MSDLQSDVGPMVAMDLVNNQSINQSIHPSIHPSIRKKGSLQFLLFLEKAANQDGGLLLDDRKGREGATHY